jgi:hypothetical protein
MICVAELQYEEEPCIIGLLLMQGLFKCLRDWSLEADEYDIFIIPSFLSHLCLTPSLQKCCFVILGTLPSFTPPVYCLRFDKLHVLSMSFSVSTLKSASYRKVTAVSFPDLYLMNNSRNRISVSYCSEQCGNLPEGRPPNAFLQKEKHSLFQHPSAYRTKSFACPPMLFINRLTYLIVY